MVLWWTNCHCQDCQFSRLTLVFRDAGSACSTAVGSGIMEPLLSRLQGLNTSTNGLAFTPVDPLEQHIEHQLEFQLQS